jgi:glycosyltransferase involved in cell wall biosynthesis
MYPPHHLGGYELVWRSAMRHLRAAAHDVRVLTTGFRVPSPGEPEEDGVRRDLRWWWRDHAFPELPLRERLAVERHNGRVLERELRDFRPDVVTWWSMGGMSLSMLERVRGRVAAVAFVHDDWLDYGPRVDAWLKLFTGPRRGRLAGPVDALLRMPTRVDFDCAARYVFVSERTRQRALAAGRAPGDWGIAHSGIDPSYVDPRPERPWAWRLLYVGRIDMRKGIGTAVDALTKLPGEATLTIVGEGDPGTEAELREQARRLGVADRIRLEGFRPRAELPAAYEAADVVVFPVIWEEPWGLVPIEAMALGRPVVATGRGGSGEYLRDGQNALLFEAGDAGALAGAVTRLAGDPALRARLREGGAATAPLHTEAVFNAAVLREVEAACS